MELPLVQDYQLEVNVPDIGCNEASRILNKKIICKECELPMCLDDLTINDKYYLGRYSEIMAVFRKLDRGCSLQEIEQSQKVDIVIIKMWQKRRDYIENIYRTKSDMIIHMGKANA